MYWTTEGTVLPGLNRIEDSNVDNLLITDRRPKKSDDNSSNSTFRPDEIKHLWQIIIYIQYKSKSH